jgi:hypothetical protein
MPGFDFWKRIFRRRSQIWGALPEPGTSIELGLTNRDAKVNNRNPRKAFAANFNVDLEHLFTIKTKEALEAYVKSTDDFGRPVTTIPISKTSSTIFFDFASSGMTLPYDGKDVELSRFVLDLGYGLRDGLIPRREMLDYLQIERAEDLILKRLSWLPEMEQWYPLFTEKERGQPA